MPYSSIDPYEGSEDYVFVSYSRKDRIVVKKILRRLQNDRIRFWYDSGIHYGDDWDQSVASHVSDARCFLALISKEYVESRNCLAELRFALRKEVVIIPVYLDSAKTPSYLIDWIEMRLSTIQAIFALSFSEGFFENSSFFIELESAEAIAKCKNSQVFRTEGWGPARTMYSHDKPADHAVINCLKDNPIIGDERVFVFMAESTEQKLSFSSKKIRIYPHREYQVRVYFNNGAQAGLNRKLVGAARETKMRALFPMALKSEEQGEVSAVIAWICGTTSPDTIDDIHVNKVWDNIPIVADSPVELFYKTNSAKIHTDLNHGQVLSTKLFSSEGTYIGTDKLNGLVLAGDEYSGWVEFTIVVKPAGAEELRQKSRDLLKKSWRNCK